MTSPQGRKPEARLAEMEDNLASMKKERLSGKLTEDVYYKAAKPLARDIAKLREQVRLT